MEKSALALTSEQTLVQMIKENGHDTLFVFDHPPSIGELDEMYAKYMIVQLKLAIGRAVMGVMCSGMAR